MTLDPKRKRIPTPIEEQMKSSYLNYAMSVIIGRALPDVRDGMKPVHRRILFAMSELKNTWNQPYKKSARVVGDVIGKYHPHGDTAAYDALVRMAQTFNMRLPLVDGQGNFGSVDGDPAAAMRYTEVRMTRLSAEVLADLEKDTVDFVPTYDESSEEPSVLPTRVPNLLLNGSEGIAVGMATRIPPHNLTELIDGLVLLIEDSAATVTDLHRIIRGPDFPTGATIHGLEGIRDAYETGRGSIKIRAKAHFEPIRQNSDREQIVITEIPFQVNKARTLERIAELVRDKEIDGISDLRDESDKDGLRMVIELKKDAYPQVVLNTLYKKTPLEMSFGINLLAIADGQPKTFNLKEMLVAFLNHRREVVIRRTKYDLAKAEERAHILEGLRKAIDIIDEIVALIKRSASADEAKKGLIELFGFSAIQAQEILNMRLHRLTALEKDELVNELNELMHLIERLRAILASDALLMQVIRDELVEIKEAYGDPRRTDIVPDEGEINPEDLIEKKDVVVTVTHRGYIKRVPVDTYRTQKRGGKGKSGMGVKEEDVVRDLFVASTHDAIWMFTTAGRMFSLKVYELPEGSRQAKGKPIIQILPLSADERIAAIIPAHRMDDIPHVMFVTRAGIIKKSLSSVYAAVKINGTRAIRLDEGDELIDVRLFGEGDDIALCTRKGMSIRFRGDSVRHIGRVARGVIGIRLGRGDEVVGVSVTRADDDHLLLTATERGYGKKTRPENYRVQSRGGKGIMTIKITAKNGDVMGMLRVKNDDQLMLISSNGRIIRILVKDISTTLRYAQGIRLVNLDEDERVVGITVLPESEQDEAADIELARPSEPTDEAPEELTPPDPEDELPPDDEPAEPETDEE
jgi:DNA gyrase subunit A